MRGRGGWRGSLFFGTVSGVGGRKVIQGNFSERTSGDAALAKGEGGV